MDAKFLRCGPNWFLDDDNGTTIGVGDEAVQNVRLKESKLTN